ncbi:MAG: nucleotidyltransferase [Nitrosomonadales bacterium]|nr:nucleotidyltransferase [Nitrosomonadales bacterium]
MSGLFSAQQVIAPRSPSLGALGLLNPLAVSAALPWVAVSQRFEQFHSNLGLTPTQQLDGYTKYAGVVSCLNRAYYGTSSESDNSFFVGSWGKNTTIRPPRDIDVYFLLPAAVYHRFQNYTYNRQSALLQEVKNQLSLTYTNTDMSGDGQVVVVNFGSYCVEVVPAFALATEGRYWICDTHNGGLYKETAPWSEMGHLETADMTNAGNLRPLIRMLKAWQAYCSVPIKSFHLELLAAEFIAQSPWRLNSWFYFDWIIRDFFYFIYHRANGVVLVPGTFEIMSLGNDWQSRVESAYRRALKACSYEYDNRIIEAGDEWQKIFGTDIPRTS